MELEKGPHNNELQLKSGAEKLGRRSQLNSVFSGPCEVQTMVARDGKMFAAATVAIAFAVSCASRPPVAKLPGGAQGRRTPVEVWRGGDDGLTIRFGESLELALKDSKVFSGVTVHTPDAMQLTVESNLQPLESGDDPKASYVVILGRADGTPMGAFRGNCRPRDYTPCAKRVVAEAEHLFLGRQESRPR